MNPNPSDPVIDEIRAVRHRISARFAHDPARLVAYYTGLQEQCRERLLAPAQLQSHPTNQPPDEVSAADRARAASLP